MDVKIHIDGWQVTDDSELDTLCTLISEVTNTDYVSATIEYEELI